MCLLTRKLFTSCSVNASCVCQQESSLKVVVSMHVTVILILFEIILILGLCWKQR